MTDAARHEQYSEQVSLRESIKRLGKRVDRFKAAGSLDPVEQWAIVEHVRVLLKEAHRLEGKK
jgi:hypothetical protein